MRRACLLTILLASLTLLVPAGAGAQSAGDDQYSDPYAGRQREPRQQQAPARPPSNVESSPQRAQAGESASAAAPAASGAELPRTGVDGRMLAALGAAMLLAGALLARMVARPAGPLPLVQARQADASHQALSRVSALRGP